MSTLRTLKRSSLRATENFISFCLEHSLPRHLYSSFFTTFSSQFRCHFFREAFHSLPINSNKLSSLWYSGTRYLPYSVVFFSAMLFDNWYSICLLSIFLSHSPLLECKFHKGKDCFLYLHIHPWYIAGPQISVLQLNDWAASGINRGLTPLNCI